MNNLQTHQLIDAVRVWTGWGQSGFPWCDDERLVRHVGESLAQELLPIIKSLKRDFYLSNANCFGRSPQEIGRNASMQFKEKYPMVADEIAEAFARCYVYDFK